MTRANAGESEWTDGEAGGDRGASGASIIGRAASVIEEGMRPLLVTTNHFKQNILRSTKNVMSRLVARAGTSRRHHVEKGLGFGAKGGGWREMCGHLDKASC